MTALVRKYRYSLVFFAFFAFMLVIKLPKYGSINEWATMPYVVTYREGFDSRMLIGSIIFLFTDYLSANAMWTVVLVSTVLLAALLSWVLGEALRCCEDEAAFGAKCMALFFVLTPTSIIYLFKYLNYGRMDIYLAIFALLILACANRKYARWLIPLFCLSAMLTHHVYLFMFMPSMGITLLYEAYKNRFAKSSIALCAASYSVVILLFIYFQFSPNPVGFETADEMLEFLKTRTDAAIHYDMIFGEYFTDITAVWRSYVVPLILESALPDLPYTVLAAAPALGVLYVVWVKAFKRCEDKFIRFILFLCMFAPITMVIQCILTNDYGRDFAAVLFTQFSMLFYLVHRREESVLQSVAAIGRFFRKNLYALSAVAGYLALFLFSASDKL